MNLTIPGDNGRRKERKKISKKIIFNSNTINITTSQQSPLIPMQGNLQGQGFLLLAGVVTERGLGRKQSMPVQQLHLTDLKQDPIAS